MGCYVDVCGQREVGCIHHRYASWTRRVASAMTNVEPSPSLVVDHVVGIIGELDGACQFKWRTFIDAKFSERSVGYIKTAGLLYPCQAMRFAQSCNALDHAIGAEIHYLHGMTAGCGDEQALGRRIES